MTCLRAKNEEEREEEGKSGEWVRRGDWDAFGRRRGGKEVEEEEDEDACVSMRSKTYCSHLKIPSTSRL